MGKCHHGRQWTKCAMTEGVISKVEAHCHVQKQPIMHDGPSLTWRNGDPIAPAVVSDDNGADAGNDGDVAPPDPPMFLPPLPLNPLNLDDIDVAAVAPLPVVPVDVGARYDINQAPVQGAPAPLKEEEEIKGVVCNVIDNERDAIGAA